MSTDITIIDCGIKDYQSVLELQEKAFENLLTGIRRDAAAPQQAGKDTIFITEHFPVITLGARISANKLLKDTDTIKQSGIEIFQTRRGGGATAHNPGQLVIYPVIKLKNHSLGVSDFVRLLENIGIEFLAELGVNCGIRKGFPGLWIKDKNPRNPCNPRLKIASIGVQIKKWITFHGMAININNDLSIFDLIVPCGIEDVKMTSVEKELNKKIDLKDAKNVLKKILLKHFKG